MAKPLLEVEDLRVDFITKRGTVSAVRGVSFTIEPGESLGLVGESGSGKTAIAQTVMGLLQLPGRVAGGEIRWRGEPLGPQARLQSTDGVRGREIAMVFQDALTALNPLLPIGMQVTEVLRCVRKMGGREAQGHAVELLRLVGITDARNRMGSYPHEFSGGMRQRVMIALALACGPKLLIADEPTTALDVTIQAQVIDLLKRLQRELSLSILFITHDLGVIAALCSRVAVVYAGRIVEMAPAEDLFHRPAHPYTEGLLRSTPSLQDDQPTLKTIEGTPPDLRERTPGCSFAPRCSHASERCLSELPGLVTVAGTRLAACHHPLTEPQ